MRQPYKPLGWFSAMKKQPAPKSPDYDELKKQVCCLEKFVHRGQLWHDTLINTISNPLFYKNSQGLYPGCNKAFEAFIGRPRSDIIGKTVASPHIILQIEDNGRGFNLKKREQETLQEKRMGLWNMKARANLLHGRMAIEPRLNKGTKIIVKLKIKDGPK